MNISPFKVQSIREDFPIFSQRIKEKPLIYLDNAASTQKPNTVIDTLQNFYRYEYSNVHRGVYTLSEKATDLFENSRKKVQHFINAKQAEEIVFTKGGTEAINLVAQSYLQPRLSEDDEIVISYMEHHANIVPWKRICEQTGAKLKVIPITPTGELSLETISNLLSPRTRLLAIIHLSNVLGTLNPIEELIRLAHHKNIPVLIDGAQAVAHLPVDVQQLDCDFYTFSGHKIYGPNGIGVLYGKMHHLESMPPWQGGGGMITRVSFDKIDYQGPPHRFEAGTPPIAEAIGLGAAIDYLNQLDWAAIMEHEEKVLQYALQQLKTISKLQFIGNPTNRIAVISFVLADIHGHDIATVLNEEGIAVRAGHHCAMPLMNYFKIAATTRLSLSIYNTEEEIDSLTQALIKVQKLLG